MVSSVEEPVGAEVNREVNKDQLGIGKGIITLPAVLGLFIAFLTRSPAAEAPGVGLWSADFETGDVTQWYAPATGPSGNHGGGKYDSGIADSVVSKDHAHGGLWGLRMTISTPSSP